MMSSISMEVQNRSTMLEPFSTEFIKKLLKILVEAVAELHAKGIVHHNITN